MLHTNVCGNRSARSREEDFRVFTICGHDGHLCHVTSIMSSDFYFLVHKSFYKNFVQISKVFSEKSGLNFCMYTTLDQGQEMTLNLNSHITSYIQLDVCPY